MKTCEITQPSPSLAECVESLNGQALLLTRQGRPVAVVLPAEGADLETASLSLNPQFLAILERSRRRQQEDGGISSDEMRRRLGVATGPQRRKGGAPGGKKKG
jgi:hypothetical protein